MTGRRLYDLICDAATYEGEWVRERYLPKHSKPMPAWPDLTQAEKRLYGRVASRLKGVKR